MIFKTELEFEEALINQLKSKGWHDKVIKYPTEEDLIKNWANILFSMNRNIDCLNDQPLTDSEMNQILEQVRSLKSPLRLNDFINGKTVQIIRDNKNDKLHIGKTVSLKIYDRAEIAGGQSRYQIVQQPIFKPLSGVKDNRRGDITLLINGMPLIHIELKRSNISVNQACNQIEKYSKLGVFTGLFSLVQIFVAMEPEETLYFANPGMDKSFNKNYYFHWADYNNEPVNRWNDIATQLLSIPIAHQLIGYYSVADKLDGILKVMRSYQYYALTQIWDRVKKQKWDDDDKLGGYIWHTTGSGKTLTSFKTAELIAGANDSDKVVFLMDRIELSVQSFKEYTGFAQNENDIQETESTADLITKLKSENPKDTLIVTSIQKMSNLKYDDKSKAKDIEIINAKKIVIIVDEAHRSTFGEMLADIKKTFSRAIIFGFTGTPIQKENIKKDSTTSTIFGKELHRYSISDGIRDGNVLGFDLNYASTFSDSDLRQAVALRQADSKTVEEALSDENKQKIYYHFMNKHEVKMAKHINNEGIEVPGIEDYVGQVQYQSDKHRRTVLKEIKKDWTMLSVNYKFHSIFATSSIVEAIEYFKLFKEIMPNLKVTTIFDASIDGNQNPEKELFIEESLNEILNTYNDNFKTGYKYQTYDLYKKDVANRLAHKRPYHNINEDLQLDIVIVVNQLLTGYDSKWVNTLYLDKILEHEHLIQAFSRTNRLFKVNEKPFGIIKYFRKIHTMHLNIEKAMQNYSGDKPLGLFVDKLNKNLNNMNLTLTDITNIFTSSNIENFQSLPESEEDRNYFAKCFNKLNRLMECAKIQGFHFGKQIYTCDVNKKKVNITSELTKEIYDILLVRYSELAKKRFPHDQSLPYDIESYLTSVSSDTIDSNYMNSKFTKFIKEIYNNNKEAKEKALEELHRTFGILTQEEQKIANIFLDDILAGNITVDSNKTLRDYITEYTAKKDNDKFRVFCNSTGINEEILREFYLKNITEENLNEYGKYDTLKKSSNMDLLKEYYMKKDGIEYDIFDLNLKLDNLLRDFLFNKNTDLL